MWLLGWVAANDGNVSVKLDDGTFMATPSGVSKGDMTPEKLTRVDRAGNKLEGSGEYRPSSEMRMHLRCYAERDDVGAVVHAHPPAATGFAAAHRALDEYSVTEPVVALGAGPVAPYATPSTRELPDAIAPYLARHDAVLLMNHGALTVGADLLTAYHRMETVELFAKITLNAAILGGAREISRDNIEKLVGLRKNYGITGRHPGYVKYNG
jgi:L-fuculose-phosphate aldolase